MHYVYLLKLHNGQIYTGYSNSLLQRIKKHKSGNVRATKHFLPCQLIFYASFGSKEKALQFERYLKSGSGFAFRNKHFL